MLSEAWCYSCHTNVSITGLTTATWQHSVLQKLQLLTPVLDCVQLLM